MSEEMLEEIRQVSKEYPDGIHRRSEAREMFEELGYYDVSKNYHNLIRYEKHKFINNIPVTKTIEFEIGIFNGGNEVLVMTRYDGSSGCSHLTTQELQAINKQIEELGWK